MKMISISKVGGAGFPAPSFSVEKLRELVSYDPETGIFVRLVQTSSGALVGDVAGNPDTYGYLHFRVQGRLYLAHRLAWYHFFGEWPTTELDHINQIRNDNRIVNLRLVNRLINSQNASLSKNNTSGFNGVNWKRNRWIAQIQCNGKKIHIGSFKKKADAIMARKVANIKYGFHENHGS